MKVDDIFTKEQYKEGMFLYSIKKDAIPKIIKNLRKEFGEVNNSIYSQMVESLESIEGIAIPEECFYDPNDYRSPLVMLENITRTYSNCANLERRMGINSENIRILRDYSFALNEYTNVVFSGVKIILGDPDYEILMKRMSDSVQRLKEKHEELKTKMGVATACVELKVKKPKKN